MSLQVNKASDMLQTECCSSTSGSQVSFYHLDLVDRDNIDTFCDTVVSLNKPIATLICNAGMFTVDKSIITTGFGDYESMYLVNVVGHYIVTMKLLPAIKRYTKSGKQCLIVNLSSSSCWFGKVYIYVGRVN